MKETLMKIAEIEVSYRPTISRKPIIKTAFDAFTELIEFFPADTIALQESFLSMYMNRANRVLGIYPLSTGGITGTVADTRLILSVALKVGATGIILCHNHPSGNLKPSYQDIELTKKIKEACKILDIILIDHLIVSPERTYCSLADEGLL